MEQGVQNVRLDQINNLNQALDDVKADIANKDTEITDLKQAHNEAIAEKDISFEKLTNDYKISTVKNGELEVSKKLTLL